MVLAGSKTPTEWYSWTHQPQWCTSGKTYFRKNISLHIMRKKKSKRNNPSDTKIGKEGGGGVSSSWRERDSSAASGEDHSRIGISSSPWRNSHQGRQIFSEGTMVCKKPMLEQFHLTGTVAYGLIHTGVAQSMRRNEKQRGTVKDCPSLPFLISYPIRVAKEKKSLGKNGWRYKKSV